MKKTPPPLPAKLHNANPPPAMLKEIETLKKKGEHATAAAALFSSGYARAAGEIYEQIFEYKSALAAFEKANDIFGAMRCALALRESVAIEGVITRAIKEGKALSLLQPLERESRYVEIGHIHTALQDHEKAALAYEAADRAYLAGTAYEAVGDFRKAGIAYERHLEQDPGDARGALRLGTVLARFSRHDDAIVLLQMSIRNSDAQDRMRILASPQLVLCFEALGYRTAASRTFELWKSAAQKLESDIPENIEMFLKSGRAAFFSAMNKSEKPKVEAKVQGGGLDDFFDPPSAEAAEALVPEPQEEAMEASRYLLGGRYLLGEPLSGGGIGQVFRAYDSFTDTQVAVKIFGAGAMVSDAVKAYAREARAASSLGHPAIAQVVELNTPQGFMVTAFTEGTSIEERLQKGGEGVWLLPFIHALLDVLGAAHRVGLVHGALKPTNLFFREGTLRVLDFGANHLLSLRSTETGGLSSVWPYLSPEQLKGIDAGIQSDLYAVAAIVYRALSGDPPFAEAMSSRRDHPEPIDSHGAALIGFRDVLQKALDPDPSARFQSALEMREALPKSFDLELPKAGALSEEQEVAEAPIDGRKRYERQALIYRGESGARVYEGHDRVVKRPVWIVESDDPIDLDALSACAKISAGSQPVYDVLREQKRAVIARDEDASVPTFEELRSIPQGLARDLRALAGAIACVHDEGFAFFGFEKENALGPAGPRLRLAPAPLPKPATPSGQEQDWNAFANLVVEAFGGVREGEAREDLLRALGRAHLIDAQKQIELLEKVKVAANWAQILDEVSAVLVSGHGARVIARVAKQVLA